MSCTQFTLELNDGIERVWGVSMWSAGRGLILFRINIKIESSFVYFCSFERPAGLPPEEFFSAKTLYEKVYVKNQS